LCVFLGYGLSHQGYGCFDPVSKKLYVSRHVVFLEHVPFFSILTSSHYLITSYVIKIDPFNIDDTTPTSVPTPESVLSPIADTTPDLVLVDSPIMPAQSSPEVLVSLSPFDSVLIVSLLNFHILFIPLILVHFLLLLHLFIVFMSLHPIERLFVIHFGRML